MPHLREKIASLLIVGFNGHSLNHSDLQTWVKELPYGGLLFFDFDCNRNQWGKNLLTTTQIKTLITEINAYHHMHHPDAPKLLMAIDYEGGHVDRLKKIPDLPPTQAPKLLASLTDEDYDFALRQMASTLAELGFNLNFAPLVDLDQCKDEGIIGKFLRSFSEDPQVVSKLAMRWVEIFSSQGLGCCYKHFPGHGSAKGDTHTDFVDVTDTFKPEELYPYSFLKAMKDKPLMVMTAHVVNKQLDPQGLPATLSHKILTDLLRHTFDFQDVIISDDIQMKAIHTHFSLEETLKLTLEAGADMIILGNQMGYQNPKDLVDTIEKLVTSKQLNEQVIENAYQRVLTFKAKLNVSHIKKNTSRQENCIVDV